MNIFKASIWSSSFFLSLFSVTFSGNIFIIHSRKLFSAPFRLFITIYKFLRMFSANFPKIHFPAIFPLFIFVRAKANSSSGNSNSFHGSKVTGGVSSGNVNADNKRWGETLIYSEFSFWFVLCHFNQKTVFLIFNIFVAFLKRFFWSDGRSELGKQKEGRVIF